ncbi:putative phenylalanine--tRNA ligase beta subunit [Dictyocoela muelleri]|nr:putative phenylalanine--tRNA ligase beta subunit [Dictyocoela muelleri]
MPTITISKHKFMTSLGKHFTEQEIENLLFDFGLELEASDNDNVKIEVPANRYDLLSLEGLSQALRIYLGFETIKPLKITNLEQNDINNNQNDINDDQNDINNDKDNTNKVYCDHNTDRPFIVCAIINNIDISEMYDSFIEYQEILHQTLGRNRKILSIGTHDADKIKFPVFYKNVDKFEFVPLNSNKKISDLNEFFKSDKKFLKYCNMIHHYSVFFDSNEQILSVPPVINSEYSKITKDTKNIFIEITSHDFVRARQALNYILYSFRGESVTYLKAYGIQNYKNNFDKNNFDNDNFHKNNFDSPYKFNLKLDEINEELGLNLNIETAKKYLERMMHVVEIVSNSEIKVQVYGVRSDVLHKCDLFEDLAIAHGYNNFQIEKIKFSTIGEEDRLNKFSNKIRNEMAMCGFIEVLTFSLISRRDLNFNDSDNVALENPKSLDCEFVRNEMMSSLMKCVQSNQHVSLPIRIFEVGDVVVIEDNQKININKSDINYINNENDELNIDDKYCSVNKKAVNKRKLSVLIAGKKDHFEEIQGLVTHILMKCNLSVSFVEGLNKGFLKKRCGNIACDGFELGHFGIIDLNVCRKMGIPLVCTGFEIDLEILFDLFKKRN